MVLKQKKKTISAGMVASIFPFKEPRMFYINFVQFDTNTQDKSSPVYIIRLDGFITDSVDLLPPATKDAKIILRWDDLALPREDLNGGENGNGKKKKVRGRGGKIP